MYLFLFFTIEGVRPGIFGALLGAACGTVAFLGSHQLVPQLQ